MKSIKQGWIKVSRNITNHWLWDDPERLKWWLDLSLMAVWEDRTVMHDNRMVHLQKGQLIASVSFLARRWDKCNNTVLKFLKQLENENLITRVLVGGKTSVICIVEDDEEVNEQNDEFDEAENVHSTSTYAANGPESDANDSDSVTSTYTHKSEMSSKVNVAVSSSVSNNVNSSVSSSVNTNKRNKENKEVKNIINIINIDVENKFFDELEANSDYWELLGRSYPMYERKELLASFGRFRDECRAKSTRHESEKQLRSHFFDWLRIQQRTASPRIHTNKSFTNRNQMKNYVTDSERRPDSRKGFVLSATQPPTYTGKF